MRAHGDPPGAREQVGSSSVFLSSLCHDMQGSHAVWVAHGESTSERARARRDVAEPAPPPPHSPWARSGEELLPVNAGFAGRSASSDGRSRSSSNRAFTRAPEEQTRPLGGRSRDRKVSRPS